MNSIETEILIVGGGAAGLAAGVAASDKNVTIVDDNPHLGGQIWRSEMGKIKSPDARRLIDAVETNKVSILNNAQVFAKSRYNGLLAETRDGVVALHYEKLIIATGARERFLPFPGWTLPGVFGAGGLQALVKSGMSVKGKRIVVAGTGPLLLAVAEYLKAKGADVLAIVEQAPAAKIYKFGLSLWREPRKIAQAIALRTKLIGIPYLTDCWVTSAESCRGPRVSEGVTRTSEVTPLLTRGPLHPEPKGAEKLASVTLTRNGKQTHIECDYLACGFHLVPNIELASLLGCDIDVGFVKTDEFQRTSVENVFCAGEPTGIGGVESSLIEGKIAGLAASGQMDKARQYFPRRAKTLEFARRLNETFALRDELRHLAVAETLVCRCEDVTFKSLKPYGSWREAKLQTRCGMGPCQGRVCGAATEFLFNWRVDAARPPIFPVRMESLTSDEESN